MSTTRRWAIILCVAVLLLAALTHAGIALPVAIFAPLWFFFAAVVALLVPRIDKQWHPQPLPALPVSSPRPPPLR